jgi:beta-lactamase class A
VRQGFSFRTATRFAGVPLLVAVTASIAGLLPVGSTHAQSTHAQSTRAARSQAGGSHEGSTAARLNPLIPLNGVLDYLHSRQGDVQVAIFDKSTGRTYLVSDGPQPQYTASIVKADILARWLRRYQSSPGVIPVSLPYSIRYLMQNMITVSDNVAATSLFYFGGGCGALTRFNELIPTRDTEVGCQTPTYYGWGNTQTTAADQVAVVRTLAYRNRVLTLAARAYGLQLMESVVPTQRWGVTCGPWGTSCDGPAYATPVPGVTVALKNGWKFVPSCARQDDSCPWQVNSIGWVQGDGRDYALAVLTTDDPIGPGVYGFDYGISTIQGVSQLVWDNLQPG